MRLRHIEVFYQVYREGSISAAARNLHVSQPSVSKVLRHAEDQLGFALFDRRKGRLYPTKAAEELYGEVSEIYDRVASLNRRAGNIRNRRGGHIRLGALPSLGFSVLPRLVAEMQSAKPDMSFDLATLHSDEMTAALLEKRFDLCVGFDADFDERIRCQAINSVGLSLLVPEGHFAGELTEAQPASVDGQNLIGLRDSGPVADRIEDYLSVHQIEASITVTVQTYYLAAELVELGAGIAIVDGFTAEYFSGRAIQGVPLADSPTLPFAAMTLVEQANEPLVGDCLGALHRLYG
jgi:DNA-binding transcriptional LysR family regulator